MTREKNIPKHWEIKKLGEVCEKITNGANVKQFDDNIGFPISRIETIWNQQIDINRVKYIKEDEKAFTEKYALQHNDVLFSHINSDIHLGKTAIYKSVPKVLIHGINLLLIRTNKSINPIYFNYHLNFLRAKGTFISIAQKSVNQSSINQSKLKNVDIVLPPIPEQQAIVAKIEELLSELDNGKQQLLTAQQQLKVYRQSLLKWAFEGKLTNKDVKEGELPKGWKWVKSGELFSFVTSGSRGWAKYYADKGAIFIRITNMNFDTLELDLREEKIQYVNPPLNSEGIRTKVHEGDFLFSITGYLGMFAIAPKLENAFVNQHVCLCRPKEGFNKKYVGYWISSGSGGIHHLNKNQKGAVKSGLNLDDLKTFPVPLCPIEEQQLIVSELESKLTVCDKIEETISQSLKQAFEGRLINN